MDCPVTITQRQLYSIAPEVRAKAREALIGRRVAPLVDSGRIHEAQLVEVEEVEEDLYDDVAKATRDEKRAQLLHDMPTEFAAAAMPQDVPKPLIVPHPYESLLCTYPPAQPPSDLMVAKESSSLRAILPLVDNHLRVESIIDPGCQVIAMSEQE